MADLDIALEQQVLDLTERQRITDVQHHREANNFGRTVEIAEGIFDPLRLGSITRQLKPLQNRYVMSTASAAITFLMDGDFNKEEASREVARISRTAFSAGSFLLIDFCLIYR